MMRNLAIGQLVYLPLSMCWRYIVEMEDTVRRVAPPINASAPPPATDLQHQAYLERVSQSEINDADISKQFLSATSGRMYHNLNDDADEIDTDDNVDFKKTPTPMPDEKTPSGRKIKTKSRKDKGKRPPIASLLDETKMDKSRLTDNSKLTNNENRSARRY